MGAPSDPPAAEVTGGHRPLHVAVIIASAVVMCLMFLFNGVNTAGIPGLFLQETGDVSDKFYTEITPAGWTFSIWGVIYVWQVLFMGYSLSTICRRGPDGGYLYYSPNHNPVWLFVLYIINNILNITWLFMFDREWLVAAFIVLALIAASLIAMLLVSYIFLHRAIPTLRKSEQMVEVWLTRFMVHNGLAVYLTWTCIATLLNFVHVGAYVGSVDQSVMSTAALGVLAMEIVGWVTLDTFVLYNHTNYMFSPHIVLVWALTGSLTNNFNPWHHNTIITLVLLALAGLALVSKIVLMIWHHCRQKRPSSPLVSPAPSPDIPPKA